MGCDYYKSNILTITLKNTKTIDINLGAERGYYPDCNGTDSDCEFDSDIFLENQRSIYSPKVLFETNVWIKPDYQKKFNVYLVKNNINIDNVLTIKKRYLFIKR